MMKPPNLAIAFLSMLCLLALLVRHAVAAANAVDLAAGLIAYYPFDGNANDASGYGNHGVVHGATLAADTCGNPDSAYFFDNSRRTAIWIEVPHNDIQNTPVNAGLTLALWIHPSDATGQALITKQPSGSCAEFHDPGTSNHGGLFDTGLAAGQPYFVSQFADGCGSEGSIAQMPPFEVGAWHYLVITVDVTDPLRELVRFYRDGQLDV